MNSPTWLEVLQGVGSVATPVVVAVLAFVLARMQGRNDQLLAARMDYYRSLVPKLNTLMCYMTFIGTWAAKSPTDIVALKRELDHEFFCAMPLFDPRVKQCYDEYLRACFSTFNEWGKDARIRSGAYRRRAAWSGTSEWQTEWDELFMNADEDTISGEELQSIQAKYGRLIDALVGNLKLTKAKVEYTTDLVSLNAHAPTPPDIPGRDTAL
ncbi:hypothetical protein GTV32_16390 [Gordonia sp. SID5947]|uniref:hypothetical protein n=1 Tax=Gordonia sp. SID5947 TaxID=2690315 RepID=UPI00136DEFCD|nr:hypothetical protein [Gordonia sp. SID5947]MYR07782.1 hypothetical protein [Gordonia sp. SID5947]